MTSRPQDGYAMLAALHQRYCEDSARSYFADWHRAISDCSERRKQTLVDLTVDSANLTLTVQSSPAVLGDPLVASAIRDTNPAFDFANPPTADALEGAVSAAKGKYFEYLVVDRLNNGERVGDIVLPECFTARVAESTTQPGWDVQILDSDLQGDEYLQLKATDSASYIKDALDRYPDIMILTTDEVANASFAGAHVLDANIQNSWLDQVVRDAMGVDLSFGEAFFGAFNPLLSLGFIVGTEGYRVVVSDKDAKRAVVAVAHRGTRTIASQSVGALVYAAGGGWLMLPAAFVSGLVYERLAELYEANSLLEESRRHLLLLRLAQQDRLLTKA